VKEVRAWKEEENVKDIAKLPKKYRRVCTLNLT
jgi:hypothetical protein